MHYSAITQKLLGQLRAIEPSRDGSLEYHPSIVTLRDGREIDCVYVLPFDDTSRCGVLLRSKIRRSEQFGSTRLPPFERARPGFPPSWPTRSMRPASQAWGTARSHSYSLMASHSATRPATRSTSCPCQKGRTPAISSRQFHIPRHGSAMTGLPFRITGACTRVHLRLPNIGLQPTVDLASIK
jgi:hypothetical protein